MDFFVCHDAFCVSFTISQTAKLWSCLTLNYKHYRNGGLVEICIIVLCSGSGRVFVIWSTIWGKEFHVILKKSLCLFSLHALYIHITAAFLMQELLENMLIIAACLSATECYFSACGLHIEWLKLEKMDESGTPHRWMPRCGWHSVYMVWCYSDPLSQL